jgi:NhaA family Na+:H+ antiporter
MATDIAFAIEFYLFWKSSSYFAQSILTALAVIDDLGAILVIAIFYTETIAFINLFIAFAIMGGFILNRRNVHSLFPYLIGRCHVVFHAKWGSCYNYRRIAGICDSVWQWRKTSSYRLQHFTQTCRLFLFFPYLQ